MEKVLKWFYFLSEKIKRREFHYQAKLIEMNYLLFLQLLQSRPDLQIDQTLMYALSSEMSYGQFYVPVDNLCLSSKLKRPFWQGEYIHGVVAFPLSPLVFLSLLFQEREDNGRYHFLDFTSSAVYVKFKTQNSQSLRQSTSEAFILLSKSNGKYYLRFLDANERLESGTHIWYSFE